MRLFCSLCALACLTAATIGAAGSHSGCLAVAGERIQAQDLAKANPVFGDLPPGSDLGFTPAPGARRILNAAELIRFGRQNGLKIDSAEDICVERASEPLTAERLLPALKKALEGTGAQVEILDFSHYRLPIGDLQFERSGLASPPPGNPGAPVIWHGKLLYEAHRSLIIWARVKLTAQCTWVEAKETLVSGRPIQAGQIVARTGPRFPFGPQAPETSEVVVGKVPRRTIPAGQAIGSDMLVAPMAVKAGESVSVAVSSGGARLRLEAKAESSGHLGENVTLRNPLNGKPFVGRVQGKGKVEIEAIRK